MNMMDLRRRMLMDLLRKLVIFNTTLRAGEIIESSYSEINLDSGCIDVKGKKVIESRVLPYDADEYTEEEARAAAEADGYEVDYCQIMADEESGGSTIHVYCRKTFSYSGYIQIGSYDFAKYNTLKFTVTNYSGSGSITFGDVSEPITADGEYSIDIENYEGSFNIKFSSDDVSGYSVNNIYLENI